MKLIKDLKEGDKLQTQLLVGSSAKGVTNNGLSYLTLEFRDSSGQIIGKKWEVSSADEDIFQVGNVVEVIIEVIFYKTSLQAKVLSAKKVNEEDIDFTKFIKAPPVPKEELVARLYQHIDEIKDEEIKLLTKTIVERYKEKLFDYPAAVSIHHEFASGLLFHSLSMADVASFLASYYPNINKDLLVAGTILHDIGKTIELVGPVVFKYTLEGKLIGHISIMNSIIKETAEELHIDEEKRILMQHMILSHHGEHEFGSPVLPETREAILLHLIDNIDSKMMIVNKALEVTEPGEFSSKIFALDGRSLYNPKFDKE